LEKISLILLEKGGKGGFKEENTLFSQKISPYPSLLKRGKERDFAKEGK